MVSGLECTTFVRSLMGSLLTLADTAYVGEGRFILILCTPVPSSRRKMSMLRWLIFAQVSYATCLRLPPESIPFWACRQVIPRESIPILACRQVMKSRVYQMMPSVHIPWSRGSYVWDVTSPRIVRCGVSSFITHLSPFFTSGVGKKLLRPRPGTMSLCTRTES